jgi:hypothetical protein
MPFRLWFYLAQVGAPIVFATIFFTFSAPKDSFAGHIRVVAICIFILLGVTGMILGGLMVAGRLRMCCPFCSKPGSTGFNKSDGMWMECESCGFVHGDGLLRLKIVKGEIEEESDDVV